MTDIVLINPISGLERGWGKFKIVGNALPPMNLALLAAVLRQRGYHITIFDRAVFRGNVEDEISRILETEPLCIGFSACTISINPAVQIAKLIKRIRPSAYLILGGVHLSAIPERVMQEYSEFRIGVIGEGEQTLPDLLEAMKRGRELRQIPGIIYREGGEVKRTAPRPLIENLDNLPYPAWDLLPWLPRNYRPEPQAFYRLPSAGLVTSRGCYGRCTFCDRTICGNRIRFHSAEYVFEQIKSLWKTYGIRDIFFMDDNFLVHRGRLEKLCDLLKYSGSNLKWSCMANIGNVDRDLLKLLKKYGCWQISYGIESGSQRVLDFVKKGITIEQVRRAVRLTHEAGIMVRGFFMAGLPTETAEDREATRKLIQELDLDDMQVGLFSPYPGTELAKEIHLYGDVIQDWDRYSGAAPPAFIPFGATEEEIVAFQASCVFRFYLSGRVLWRYAIRALRNYYFLYKLWLGARAVISGCVVPLIQRNIKRFFRVKGS